ncbi:peptide chain release factor N(5)-glutamine methyltransferase [Alteromonas ponticola]|uniref:Release factor glutamine methyltransferase n=1 Tax=Alteromonas aquimaris TaxID=2998417 RepID=A0ABT3P7V1_9ALTE|nr:peptide chain release factor N(5)-glutamine methyltransferase [Alteromonas aquimaris]MCW8108824.1 peptide chain release factor N(5)-glutamine methyltransferase [Alteromonas aquimaris]
MRIEQALRWAQQELVGTESPSIDSRALLCHCLGESQSYLYTWPEREITASHLERFMELVAQRKQGKPIAYLRGYQEFWSLTFNVSAATLIPRPETELIVEKTLALNNIDNPVILDLGTGTGAIAIALASELPDADVIGVDKVPDAIALAKSNALLNQISNVTFMQSDWFSALRNQTFNVIVSNPPYVESASEYLAQGDVRFEPTSALTAGEDGLDDIHQILAGASAHLTDNGILLMEHGFEQGVAVREIFARHGFSDVTTIKDINLLDRVTFGRWCTCE